MSGFRELVDLGVSFRPFDGPPPPEGGTRSPFAAPWSTTVANLAAELRHLDAARVVVEVGLGEHELRLDGLPRASARMTTDAVRISFDSRHGPLRYGTGEFTTTWGAPGWQANVRAIALALEALRKVDRYGVSRRGEQYRGWRQLPAGTPATPELAIVTRDQAIDALHAEVADLYDRDDVAGAFQADAIREALRRTHPDRGGSADAFRRVQRAREVLA